MQTHDYSLHGLRVRILCEGGPLPGVRWMIQKLDAFSGPAIQDPTRQDLAPAIEVRVGAFDVDTRGWMNVDHQYYARLNELCFVGGWNGVRYRTHWEGLDAGHAGPVKVRLEVGRKGLVRFPWLMQADWITYMFVLKPLTELLWARRGRFVMHAAAAAKHGRAAVFTGYGSSLKTSFVMKLVRRGWSLLGDDQVLLTPEGLLPLAVGLRTFDFRAFHLPTEYLTPWRLARLSVHLLRRREPRVQVAGLSALGSMNVLVRTSRGEAFWEPLAPAEAARRVVVNCRAETVQAVRASPPVSRPLLAYQLMFPAFDHDVYWGAFQDLLARQLVGQPTRRVELTRRWDDRLMDAVAMPEGGG